MRCHDVRELLLRRLDAELTDSTDNLDEAALKDHLKLCAACRAFEQRQHHVDALLNVPTLSASSRREHHATPSTPSTLSPVPLTMSRPGRVSTSTIMLAVEQRKRVSQQLEQIQHQQQHRVARMRTGGLAFALLAFLALGSVPLLLLTILLVQTDMIVDILSFLRSVIDVLYVLALSLQSTLIIVTHNNVLLSLLAFVVVLMTAMWIRLMRPKGEW